MIYVTQLLSVQITDQFAHLTPMLHVMFAYIELNQNLEFETFKNCHICVQNKL